MRRAGAFLCCAVLAVAVAGCGGSGGGGGSVRSNLDDLAKWFTGVNAKVTRLDEQGLSITRFEVSPPPASSLAALSETGVQAGNSAKASARELDEVTRFTLEEAGNIFCYSFSSWVENRVMPETPEFEEAFVGYVLGQAVPGTPEEQLWGIAERFREAIVNARSEGEAAALTAVATACSAQELSP